MNGNLFRPRLGMFVTLAHLRPLVTVCLGMALFVPTFAGCGGGGDRHGISGTVHFQKEPLESGSIRFVGVDDPTIQTGGVISDGSYSIPAEHGLPPGKYKVQIYAGGGEQEVSDAPGDPGEGTEEPIPAKYNEQTTLEVTVEEGGPYTFDFPDLE